MDVYGSAFAVFRLGMGGWVGCCGYSQSHGQPTTVAHVTGGWCWLVHPLLPCQALGQALVLCRQGKGVYGWCCTVHQCHPAALWFDESPITLCQRARL